MLEDTNKSALAHVERSLHHARVQVETQKRAQTDPKLRAGHAGPAVLTPMGANGGMFRPQ
jgi:hypothetical protein